LAGLSSLSGEAATAPRGRWLGRVVTLLVAIGIWAGRLGSVVPAALKGNRGVKIYTLAILLLLSLPIAVVLPIAFTKSPFLAFPPQGFSLKWFQSFLVSPIWQAAWLRSLVVATTTGLAALFLGLGASLALARLPSHWTKPMFAFLIAPLIVPRIVLAVGLFYLYARLGLSGTNLGLIIGHTVLAIPYVVVTLAAAFKNFDWRLDDAAKILGASLPNRLRTVMLPLLMPSLVAAFLFAFITSFDELTIALFVSGGLQTTLPKQMWDDMQLQLNPTLAAVAATLTATIVLLVLIPTFFKRAD
jgi:putative spermidine/putrescine transport system permease protein